MKIFRHIALPFLPGLGWLIAASPLQGLSNDADKVQIRFSNHTEASDLSSNQVEDLILHGGWTWLATSNGLNQFNIYKNVSHFHDPNDTSTISSNKLTSVAPGLDGSVWIGTTDAGLNQFDPQTGKFTRWFPGLTQNGEQAARELPSQTITRLATSEGHFLWIGTDKGLAVMNLLSQNVRRMEGELESARISSVAVFDDREVWVGTSTGEIHRWNFRTSEFDRVGRLSAPIRAISRDTRLQTWIGTEGAGLFRFEEDGEHEPIELETRDINSIIADDNGDLWLGTSRGLVRLDSKDRSDTIYRSNKSIPHTLAHDYVTKVVQDKEKRMVWIATRGGGTSRFSQDRYWFPLVKSGDQGIQFPHRSIWSMAVQDSHVWMGTERGIFRWSPLRNEVDSSLPGLDQIGGVYAISMITDRDENLWIGTKGDGLIKRTPFGNVVRYRHQEDDPTTLGQNHISELFEDSTGRIWIGTYGKGIFRYDKRSDQFIGPRKSSSEQPFFINRIREDENQTIWAGADEGLFAFDEGNGTWQFGHEAIQANDLRFTRKVTDILARDRYLWVGTELKGIIRIDLSNGVSTRYNAENCDLPDERIQGIIQEDSGVLWIATESGISRLSSTDTTGSIIRNFTIDDGLQPGKFHPNARAKKKVNNRQILFFGGSEGFNPIDPSEYPKVIQPPRPILTDLEYFGKSLVPRPGTILEKPLSSTPVLEIPYDSRNQFAFRFANLDYRFPNRGFFRYKMQNFREDWTMADRDRRASYQGLPIGNYTFVVQSSPDGEKWTKNVARMAIKITPPWWRTWWFRLSSTALLLTAAISLVRLYFRSRIKAIERREAKISSERDRAEVALARQLQHAVLLERTSRGFHHGERGRDFHQSAEEPRGTSRGGSRDDLQANRRGRGHGQRFDQADCQLLSRRKTSIASPAPLRQGQGDSTGYPFGIGFRHVDTDDDRFLSQFHRRHTDDPFDSLCQHAFPQPGQRCDCPSLTPDVR